MLTFGSAVEQNHGADLKYQPHVLFYAIIHFNLFLLFIAISYYFVLSMFVADIWEHGDIAVKSEWTKKLEQPDNQTACKQFSLSRLSEALPLEVKLKASTPETLLTGTLCAQQHSRSDLKQKGLLMSLQT